MDILNQFGFDIKLFIAQIVNFLVLAFLFKKFLYKPILTTLKKRETTIKKGLEDALGAQKALENAESEKNEILQKASQEAEKIINEARKVAEEARDSILDDARAESSKVMANMKEQIKLEKEEFIKESKSIALSLSQSILEESIKGLFDKKEQQSLIQKGMKRIKSI